jgi:nucleoside-diphosphate-sugar epimerase
MSNLTIAILGSNSHIGKGLIDRFMRYNASSLRLFTRSPESLVEFLGRLGHIPDNHCYIEDGYNGFYRERYDVIINCIGIGAPNKLSGRFSDWFTVTEEYDNLTLDYLRQKTDTLYINFSSGAVYGQNLQKPVDENSANSISVNRISIANYYAVAKLNAEAKHRSLEGLNIIDLRIFSYFSRFIDINSGYFITEILQCLLKKTPFITNDLNIIRDYIHPDDLYNLVSLCIRKPGLNTALDAYSAKPCEKREIIQYFTQRHGLRSIVNESFDKASPNGLNVVYCSRYNGARSLLNYNPAYSSLQTIDLECRPLLARNTLLPMN